MFAPRPRLFSLHLNEIRRQGPEFMEVPMGTHEQVLVLSVDERQIAYEIPDVRPDAELVDPSNVDCDAHDRSGVIIMKPCPVAFCPPA